METNAHPSATYKDDLSPDLYAKVLALMDEIINERARSQLQHQASTTKDLLKMDTGARPTIDITNTDEAELVPPILQVLTSAPSLYSQYGGVIVRHRDGGKGKIEALDANSLRAEIVDRIEFVKLIGDRSVKARLPQDAVNHILCGDRKVDLPQFREFRHQAFAPFFAADKTLVYQSGYHEGSRTILTLPAELEGMPPIAVKPTPGNVAAAAKFLCEELLADFPFSPFEASRAHMLGAIITPFIRPILGDGLVPQLGIAAPSHGSGKSLLAKIPGLIATGEDQPMMAARADADEQRKVITSILKEGRLLACWDNVRQGDIIGGSPLAAVLSSSVWEDRLLGTNNARRWPNRCQWIVTGNNLRFTGELARRTLVVQLKPKTANPHLRDGDSFKHWPLEDWIKANRVQLIRAILVLVQNWIVNHNRAPFEARTFLTFEQYGRVVGGILQAAGLDAGFLTRTKDIGGNDESLDGDASDTVDAMDDTDPDDLMRSFIKAWAISPGYGTYTAKQLFEYAPKSWHGTIITSPTENGRIKQFSIFLSRNKSRVLDGEHKIMLISKAGEENTYRLISTKS